MVIFQSYLIWIDIYLWSIDIYQSCEGGHNGHAGPFKVDSTSPKSTCATYGNPKKIPQSAMEIHEFQCFTLRYMMFISKWLRSMEEIYGLNGQMRLNHSPYWVSSVVYDKNILPTDKAGIYKARPPFIAKLGLRTELGEFFYGFLGGQNGHYILLRAGAPASLPQLVFNKWKFTINL